jgi:hypothetical protein
LRERLSRLVLQLKRLELIAFERELKFTYLPTGNLYEAPDANAHERNHKNPEDDNRTSGPEQARFHDPVTKPRAKFLR